MFPKLRTRLPLFRRFFYLTSPNYRLYNQVQTIDLIESYENYLTEAQSPGEEISLLFWIKTKIKGCNPDEFGQLAGAYTELAYSRYPILKDSIMELDAEHFYGLLSTYSNFDMRNSIDLFIDKFYTLIKEEIKNNATIVTEKGEFSTKKKILEIHLFTKILKFFAYNKRTVSKSEIGKDLPEYCQLYIKKYFNEFSTSDKACALFYLSALGHSLPGSK